MDVLIIVADNIRRRAKKDPTTLEELWLLPPKEKALVSGNHLG